MIWTLCAASLVRRYSRRAMNALRMMSDSSGDSDISCRKTGRGIRWITPPPGIRAENMAACPVSMSSSPRNEPGPKIAMTCSGSPNAASLTTSKSPASTSMKS